MLIQTTRFVLHSCGYPCRDELLPQLLAEGITADIDHLPVTVQLVNCLPTKYVLDFQMERNVRERMSVQDNEVLQHCNKSSISVLSQLRLKNSFGSSHVTVRGTNTNLSSCLTNASFVSLRPGGLTRPCWI